MTRRAIYSNSLSPNLTFWDGVRALFSWGSRDFSAFFHTPRYLTASSARALFGLVIDRINLPKDKTIALPAFCCAVMATPFLSRGYKITWLDTDTRGVISVADFQKKISNVGAVVVPHIFGQRAPVAEISQIAKAHKIFVIEDCAHFFNLKDEGADVKIFSFGREKVYSCVSGGALLWSGGLDFSQVKLPKSPWTWTLRHLLQVIVLGAYVPLWYWGGRYIAAAFSRLGIFPRAVTPAEKSGQEDYPQTALAPLLQRLLYRQLSQRSAIDARRAQIAQTWRKALPSVRIPDYPLRVLTTVPDRAAVLVRAEAAGFDLKDWEGAPIAPHADVTKFGYTMGSCPHAEQYARIYLTLPTSRRVNPAAIATFVAANPLKPSNHV